MITKIQSFTDVITNSSSTVFVMCEAQAEYYDQLPHTEGCIDVEPITLNWLRMHPYEVEMVCDLLGVDPSEVTTLHQGSWGTYWDDPDPDAWETFLTTYTDKIQEVFIDGGLYWVSIEDNFEGAWEVTEDASDVADWVDYRH